MTNKRNIIKELREVEASMLHDLKEHWKNPFSTPKSYFDDLNDDLRKVTLDQKLSIDKSKKAFNVPENYFNDLKQNLKQIPKNELKSESSEKGKTISLTQYQKKQQFSAWKYIRSFSAVAASLLIVIMAWKLISTPEASISAEEQLAQALGASFSGDELQTYIEDYYLGTDEEEFLSIIDETELDELESQLFEVSEEYIYDNLDVSDLETYYDII